MRIRSITTDYDLREDRIRLAVAYADGSKQPMWLTRRLAERLVPALIKGLQPPLVGDEGQAAEVQAAQVYAQLEARVSRKPARPVQVDDSAVPILVHEINVKMAKDGTRLLTLTCPEAEPAQLVLKPGELRQWLEVLYRAFDKGQWRKDIWPAWIQHCKPSKT
jgi:hypothetical protein